MTTTTNDNLYSKVEKLVQQSKRGETQSERVVPMNEAIYLLTNEFEADLTTLIANYKGYLTVDTLVGTAEDIFQKVMLDDDAYEPIGSEEIL